MTDSAKLLTISILERELDLLKLSDDPDIILESKYVPNLQIRDWIKKRVKELKEDKHIKGAIDKYLEFQETHTMRLMKAAKGAVDKLTSYFENIDFLEKGENGKPLYNAKDVAINLEKVGSIVESLDKLETKIKKEIKTDSRVRGGGDIGLYER